MLGNRQWPLPKADRLHRHRSCLASPVSDCQDKLLALQTVGHLHRPMRRHPLRPAPRLYHHPLPLSLHLLIPRLHQAILLHLLQNHCLHPAHLERERHLAKKKRRIWLSVPMCQAQLMGKQRRPQAVLAGKRGRGKRQMHLNQKPRLHPLRLQQFPHLPLNLLRNPSNEHVTASNIVPSTFPSKHLPAGNLPWSPLLSLNIPLDKVHALSMISQWSIWRRY
ncbi:hypothetical protein I315_01615 [Cryptococcus gattii Ru294]|nr:hypothetical protein I315_01615 [Cryptococcus gattii Ru294]